jgi:hypothetical protein
MTDAEVDEAREVVGAYRQAHAYPLTLVTMGLRQFVERETPKSGLPLLPLCATCGSATHQTRRLSVGSRSG